MDLQENEDIKHGSVIRDGKLGKAEVRVMETIFARSR